LNGSHPNNDHADTPTSDQLRDLVLDALEDFKATDIQQIDVSGQNPLTDVFVIASGNSTRHIKSMAENLIMKVKAAGCPPLGVEGQRQAEWVLVDLNDVIVHLMLPKTRAFYNLEKLWQASREQRNTAGRLA
jgi:ribosome-associated protein